MEQARDWMTKGKTIAGLLEDRPVDCGAAGGLHEHPVAASALKRVDLQVWLLVAAGDTGVAEQVAHAHDRRRTL